MRIVSAVIVPEEVWVQLGLPGPMQVTATFEDGTVETLFSYYSDEIQFTADEFVGLTACEARQLHYDRDLAWIRS